MTLSAEDLGRRIIEINRKVRLGDTTPAEWALRVERLLRAQPEISGPVEVRDVRPLQGGAGSSSGTLFFEASYINADTQVHGNFVLRFRPAEQLFHVYDLDAQVRIQRALAESGIPTPPQSWEDIPGRRLTVPGYIMERVPGEAAPAAWFAEGVIAAASPAQRRAMFESYFETLAAIHNVDWRRWGLSFLLDRAQGDSLIEREANWYRDALVWAGETPTLARFAPIHDWIVANQPQPTRAVLCHGDTNLTNNLFANGRVSAVLDWEMAFIGPPEADLAYAIEGMSALSTDWPEGVPDPQEMVALYETFAAQPIRHLDYYRLFALYRMVMIFTLGMRAFPPDFQDAFKVYVEATVDRLHERARQLGAM